MSRYLLAAAGLVGSAVASSVSCPANLPLSCHNSTAQDTCCFNYPGGSLLQTQFWDTDPATGPINSWTIHGLWPDNCDGTYQSNCDSARAYTNITQILQAGAPSVLQYMQTYWKDYQGNDESFWEHEWGKHGTCISTLDPECYDGYQPTQEAVDFFTKTTQLFQGLPTYAWLEAAGITPSSSKTYTLAAMQSAIKAKFGHNVVINCKSSAVDEIWYFYNVQGSVQSGTFTPADPIGSGSTCPSSGIKYLPKSSGTSVGTSGPTSTPTGKTTTPPGTTTTAPGSGPTGSVSGKGVLNVVSSGSTKGCIISGGTWYTSGTCATFTATPSGSGFTLSSSKGKCAITSNALTCSSSVSTATVFGYDGTHITYSGSANFYASSVPSGSAQSTVYSTSNSVTLQITWQAS